MRARLERLLAVGGRRTDGRLPPRARPRSCGITAASSGAARGWSKAIDEVAALREAFWEDLALPGEATELNQELERAGRVADFLELGELMCRDALAREESSGCHFRAEHQTDDGEARRDDAHFAHVAAWMPGEGGQGPARLVEPLHFAVARACTSGRTSEAVDEGHLPSLATARSAGGGRLRPLRGRRRAPEMTLLEVLDRLNEGW